MKKNNRFLIWDFDGTLARRIGGWSGALVSVLEKNDPGTQITIENIRPYLQSGFPWHAPEIAHPDLSPEDWWQDMLVVFSRAFRSVGVDSTIAKSLARKVRSAYLKSSAWQCYDDAIPTINALSALGWQHILLSNHVPELPQLLDHLGLTSHFVAIFNSAATGWEKPNSHAFRLVQEWMLTRLKNKSPYEAWVIGDGISSDIRGAQEVGLPAILVHSTTPGITCSQTLHGLLDLLNNDGGS